MRAKRKRAEKDSLFSAVAKATRVSLAVHPLRHMNKKKADAAAFSVRGLVGQI